MKTLFAIIQHAPKVWDRGQIFWHEVAVPKGYSDMDVIERVFRSNKTMKDGDKLLEVNELSLIDPKDMQKIPKCVQNIIDKSK